MRNAECVYSHIYNCGLGESDGAGFFAATLPFLASVLRLYSSHL